MTIHTCHILPVFQLLTLDGNICWSAKKGEAGLKVSSYFDDFKRTQSVRKKVFRKQLLLFPFFFSSDFDLDDGNVYWWESYKCFYDWPLVQVIWSMGYPLTGQTTENSLPTTARSSPSGWTWGGPRKKEKKRMVFCFVIFSSTVANIHMQGVYIPHFG